MFLVLVNIGNSIRQSLPRNGLVTSLTAWVLCCILFVFAALAAFAGLLFKKVLDQRRGDDTTAGTKVNRVWITAAAVDLRSKRGTLEQELERLDWQFLHTFPLAFLVFNAAYWLGIMSSATMEEAPNILEMNVKF